MDFALPIAIVPVSPAKPVFLVSPKKYGFFHNLLDHFIPHARNDYHPHIFKLRMISLLSVLLLSAKIFTIAAIAWGPIQPAFSSAISAGNIISLTNESRVTDNLATLVENSQLDAAAQAKANDMLAKGYFSHNTPDGHTPWDFITQAGYNYISAGENLAVNFTQAENVEDAWMNSPGHRANILNNSYKDIGIGIAQGQYQGHEAIFVVQMFGSYAGEKIILNDQPTNVLNLSLSNPDQTATQSQTVSIISTQTQSLGQSLLVSAAVKGPAVKVLAVYGQQAIMLTPQANNLWQGNLDINNLAANNQSVTIKAYDISGNSQTSRVAEFSGNTASNYNFSPQVKSARVQLGGISFNPTAAEKNFYLIFLAVMALSLILALAVKRRVLHVNVVLNGSLVMVLALVLWMR